MGRRHSLWLSVLVPACLLSHIRLFAIPWTVAHQAPLPIHFSRQEHWSGGLRCAPPGDLPKSGTEPSSLMSLVLAGGFFITSAAWDAHPDNTHKIHNQHDLRCQRWVLTTLITYMRKKPNVNRHVSGWTWTRFCTSRGGTALWVRFTLIKSAH